MSHPTWVRGLKRHLRHPHAVRSWSHPTWVRGLKHRQVEEHGPQSVAPYVGAWIETGGFCAGRIKKESHPTWVRGLKPESKHALLRGLKSHPTWVRGLKLNTHTFEFELVCRTLRGCVD